MKKFKIVYEAVFTAK